MIMFADIHCHPVLKHFLFNYSIAENNKTTKEFNPLTMRVDIPKLLAGGTKLIFSSVYLPERNLITECKTFRDAYYLLKIFYKDVENKFEKNNYPGEVFHQTKRILKDFETEIKRVNGKNKIIAVAKSRKELEASLKQNKITIVQSIEGAHSLGRNLDDTDAYLKNIKQFFDEGVVSITLAHFFHNDVVNSIGGIPPSISGIAGCKNNFVTETGLSNLGKRIVEEMLRLGMIVDLTHSNLKARKEVFEINKSYNRPLIFSHVGVKKFFDHPMNPDDEEILQIKKCGGVIGIIFSNYWLTGNEESFWKFSSEKGIGMIIKAIEHIHNVTGSYENICIGSDLDGFTDPPDDLENASKMKYLNQKLSEKFPEEVVEKIMYYNAIRVLEEGWGK